MEEFTVREAATKEELDSIIALRYEVLRRPWAQPYETSRDEQEESSLNAFIADAESRVIACGRLQRLTGDTAQVRYMAVAPDCRGKGLGKIILRHLEERAREWRMKTVCLQARENALDFYKAQGYTVKEKSFLLWGQIQHYLMEKAL